MLIKSLKLDKYLVKIKDDAKFKVYSHALNWAKFRTSYN